MLNKKNRISRKLAAQYGQETLLIGQKGKYTSSAGKKVNIRSSLKTAVKKSASYPPNTPLREPDPGQEDTVVEVVNETTLSAGKRLIKAGFNPVALNFASATHPGGGFLSGALAQEEYLARSSCLYQCIQTNHMYAFHSSNYDPIHSDYTIYSPNVPVIRADTGKLLEKPYCMSIITCAAVNTFKLPSERHMEIIPAMLKRIYKVLAVGHMHAHTAIVLGAWGCGAFGNDCFIIAELFKQVLLENFRGVYKHIIFAILDSSQDQHFINPFKKVFKKNI